MQMKRFLTTECLIKSGDNLETKFYGDNIYSV